MDQAGILLFTGERCPMASRWRRRVRCTVVTDRPHAAALLSISARSALLELDGIAPGASVMLHHPIAGEIAATAGARTEVGLYLHLAGDARAIGFALVATAADMTR